MSRFRLFFLWFVVAAIPLQGLAAASMLFCGPGPHHLPQQAATAAHAQFATASDTAAGHGHGKHNPAVQLQVKTSADTAAKTVGDATHKCGVCAACCSGVAITELAHEVVVAPVAQSESAEPVVLIRARASPVPDKPPRA